MGRVELSCQSVTKNGTQCKGSPVAGQSYCWSHTPRTQIWSIRLSLITFLLGTLVGAGMTIWSTFSSWDHAERLQFTGTPRELPRVTFGDEVAFGGIKMQWIRGMRYSLGPDVTVLFDRDGRVMLEGVLRDASGQVAVCLDRYQIKVVKGADFDVNADRYGLEIVDGKRQPILQLSRSPKGLWRCQLVSFEANWKETPVGAHVLIDLREQKRNGQVPASEAVLLLQKLEPVFEYPGYKYSGVRRRIS